MDRAGNSLSPRFAIAEAKRSKRVKVDLQELVPDYFSDGKRTTNAREGGRRRCRR